MDLDTFVTTLYVKTDDYCQEHSRRVEHHGRKASLSDSEVVTLALLSQFGRFSSGLDFYRFAQACLRPLFPRLPHYSQFTRLVNAHQLLLEAVFVALADELVLPTDSYEAVDGVAACTRDRRRRGEGWLSEVASYGKSSRLGFYYGLHVLDAATPHGVVTGYLVAPASTNDQKMLDVFLGHRSQEAPPLLCVGHSVANGYLADKGCSGDCKQLERWELYRAEVLSAPQQGHGVPWSKAARHWLASHRQIIETVHDKLLHTFRLDRERPHSFEGFSARLAAKMALHNFCIWLNRQLGRNDLAFAGLLGWA